MDLAELIGIGYVAVGLVTARLVFRRLLNQEFSDELRRGMRRETPEEQLERARRSVAIDKPMFAMMGVGAGLVWPLAALVALVMVNPGKSPAESALESQIASAASATRIKELEDENERLRRITEGEA